MTRFQTLNAALTAILYQSIEDADGEEAGASSWTCDDLRDAVRDLTGTRTLHVDGVEYTLAHYQPWNSTLILTVQNAAEFRTGCRERRDLAVFPVTRASARRLANLLNIQWSA